MGSDNHLERWVNRREQIEELDAFFSSENAEAIAFVVSVIMVVAVFAWVWQ